MAHEPILSRVSIMGHPLHPVLIHFPVAALLMLVGTDLGYLYTGDFFWARGGLWLAGVGAAGGWVSGLAGLIDLVTVPRLRRLITAWSHAIIAVMLLSLASCNWLLRLGQPDAFIWPWGLGASLITAALIAAAGFLGGRNVGVDTDGAQVRHASTDSHLDRHHGLGEHQPENRHHQSR